MLVNEVLAKPPSSAAAPWGNWARRVVSDNPYRSCVPLEAAEGFHLVHASPNPINQEDHVRIFEVPSIPRARRRPETP